MKKIFTLALLVASAFATDVIAQNQVSQTKTTSLVSTVYGLENYALNSSGKYYEWFDYDDNGDKISFWATANAGYSWVKSSAAATEYPTVPGDGDETTDNSIILTTLSTGSLGTMFNSPIAAGNFFSGTFSLNVQNTLHSTLFGQKVTKKPHSLQCKYQYSRGNTYKAYVNGTYEEVDGAYDEGDIYAVLYKNKDANGNDVVLYGDDVKTNANIVATCNITGTPKSIEPTNGWTEFNLMFDYDDNEIDEDLLKEGGYSLAMVFTSSKNGASFAGAEGSKLQVEDICLVNEETSIVTTYSDKLSVVINDADPITSNENIIVTENADGTYQLDLKNFKLVSDESTINAGDISLTEIEPTIAEDGTITLATQQEITLGGDFASMSFTVPVNLTATIKDKHLKADINIYLSTMGMTIKVAFGDTTSGINSAVTTDNASKAVETYNLAGQRINGDRGRQVVITKYADGKVVKSVK